MLGDKQEDSALEKAYNKANVGQKSLSRVELCSHKEIMRLMEATPKGIFFFGTP